ncbi:iron-containing alcohol dehydrogenase [Adlercreutzia sp. ZJ304]|uniref:iron-containing alcohol dehydrogenase n=1 Tax=Adlercreutzia sp. ZJ304 TaxID=2709791 RepID=UPI0013EE0723|nr:iron-containing alcohol dehydrogenase [Adlercreutzia sp. ZJ304]
MKALIFNSGLGSRLGNLTKNNHKSMVRLNNGETIFHRQLRLLSTCGISEFVVTTGPFAWQLYVEAREFENKGCTFHFVANEIYDRTNYIYSMYCARHLLVDSDIVMIHGDLVFDAEYVRMLLASKEKSLGSVNASLSLPQKDFKARIAYNEIREISVGIFDEDCVAFQPFYKLSKEAMYIWLDAVEYFVETGETSVYAENAANTVLEKIGLKAFSYEDHVVEEIDTPDDLQRVSEMIRRIDFEQQPVFELQNGQLELLCGTCADGVNDLKSLMKSLDISKPLVVSGRHFDTYQVKDLLDKAAVNYKVFDEFNSNPTYEECLAGVNAFRSFDRDSLISVGGGSAIDVAKCIKAFVSIDSEECPVFYEIPFSDVPHLALPTTAGTGSESTHFAVCYTKGKKVSITQDCLQPEAVILDPSALKSLPDYQRKCTFLDALSHAIESYWSVKSVEQSQHYASQAIKMLIANRQAYLHGNEEAALLVMRAANYSGKAINLTTTTAAHAMSYKLTSLYSIPHGHAVAVCMPFVWDALIDACGSDLSNKADVGQLYDSFNGVRGSIRDKLHQLNTLMCGNESSEVQNIYQGVECFKRICQDMDLPVNWMPTDLSDIDVLAASVNLQRLSNFPIEFTYDQIEALYEKILTENSFLF